MASNERRVLVHPDKGALAVSVAARFLSKVGDVVAEKGVAHVVLTGGTIGIGTLAAAAASPERERVDWSKVHFWWGDERFVASDDPDRNERQAREAFLDHIPVPPVNVHAFVAADEVDSLEAGVAAYTDELARFGSPEQPWPSFDITFLGVGPDGHIASLFPGLAGIRVTDVPVVAVRNSPKPPPDRLSLTRPVINSSERVWLVLAGSDKASALGLALAGAHYTEVPAAGAKGRKRTVFFVDRDAASEVPAALIADSY